MIDNGDKEYRTNRANKPDGPNGKPLEPKPFLPKKGNNRDLLVYQKAECLYDITYYFAHHYFVERKDRTIDLVVQAARSEIRLMSLIGLIGQIGLMGLIGLIGPMSIMSCSSESIEQVAEPQQPSPTEVAISFSGQQGEEAVTRTGANRANRATPLSETATSFKVWGYKNMSYNDVTSSYGDLQTVFPGYIVNWSSSTSSPSNSDGWEYVAQQAENDPEQTIKYWDWNAKAYRYFAVTGTNTDYTDYAKSGTYGGSYETMYFTMTANASPVRDGEGTPEQKIAANIAATPYFSKLWFSTGQLPTYSDKQFGKPVQLVFMHPFARVRFLFNYSYAAEGVKVTSPMFKPTTDFDEDPTKHVKIARKGTVTVTYPLTGLATTESCTITKNASPAVGEELEAFEEEYIPEGTEKWYTVFPTDPNHPQGSYTMSVTIDNVVKTAVVPAEYMQWLLGYSYTYIFKITEQGGVEIDLVQSAVTPWTELANDHEVYNW